MLIWSLEATGVRFMITKPIIMKKIFALPGNLIANIMEHYKDMDVNFAIHGDGVLYTPKEDELIKILSKGDQLPYEVIDFDE